MNTLCVGSAENFAVCTLGIVLFKTNIKNSLELSMMESYFAFLKNLFFEELR